MYQSMYKGKYHVIRGRKIGKTFANVILQDKEFESKIYLQHSISIIIDKYGNIGINKEDGYSAYTIDPNFFMQLSKKYNIHFVVICFDEDDGNYLDLMNDMQIYIPFYTINVDKYRNKFLYAYSIHDGIMEVADIDTAFNLYHSFSQDYKCDAIFNRSDYIECMFTGKHRLGTINHMISMVKDNFRKHIQKKYEYYNEGLRRLDKIKKGEKSGWDFIDENNELVNAWINVKSKMEIIRSRGNVGDFELDEFYDEETKIVNKLDEDSNKFTFYYEDYLRFLIILTVNKHYNMDSEYTVLKDVYDTILKFLDEIKEAKTNKDYELKNVKYNEYLSKLEVCFSKLSEHRKAILRYSHDSLQFDD
ncbi:MAG: hypothetical protein IJ593_12040 [Lachnospiraceae bacterium]|nr:hypothetical protein [Lachnospiraceae bacterium]